MDPRLEGETTSPVAEYAELNRLSATLLEAVDAMARGITELRQVKQQVDFVLEVSSDP